MESYFAERVLDFEIGVFELVALFSVILLRIAGIGRQYFKIQFLDLRTD